MALMKPTEDWAVTADRAARRTGFGHAARGELALRNEIEALLRRRYPEARICHEMVMGAREVRADVVAIDPAHIVAVEVKGSNDDVSRMLHQCGMYQLCVPEVWMVVSRDKRRAAELINYLLPSIGVMTAKDDPSWRDGEWTPDIEIVSEPVPRQPHPKMMLEMMWAQELGNIVNRLRLGTIKSKKPTRNHMMGLLLEKCGVPELLRECCTELRARHALWRADAPVARDAQP